MGEKSLSLAWTWMCLGDEKMGDSGFLGIFQNGHGKRGFAPSRVWHLEIYKNFET